MPRRHNCSSHTSDKAAVSHSQHRPWHVVASRRNVCCKPVRSLVRLLRAYSTMHKGRTHSCRNAEARARTSCQDSPPTGRNARVDKPAAAAAESTVPSGVPSNSPAPRSRNTDRNCGSGCWASSRCGASSALAAVAICSVSTQRPRSEQYTVWKRVRARREACAARCQRKRRQASGVGRTNAAACARPSGVSAPGECPCVMPATLSCVTPWRTSRTRSMFSSQQKVVFLAGRAQPRLRTAPARRSIRARLRARLWEGERGAPSVFLPPSAKAGFLLSCGQAFPWRLGLRLSLRGPQACRSCSTGAPVAARQP